MSLKEIGLTDYLLNNGYKVLNREAAKTPEEKDEISHKALLCDTYLMSSNALTEDGQIVNVDCIGNRVAALIYGPKNVVVIIGANKIVKTLDDAVKRARNTAASINMQRVAGEKGRQTPCFMTGACADCLSEDSICSYVVNTRLCYPKNRIKVILVGENLGF